MSSPTPRDLRGVLRGRTDERRRRAGQAVGIAFLEVRRLIDTVEQAGIVLRDIDRDRSTSRP